jgi:hypothetical protein
MAVEAFNRELSPGGGGGFEGPIRPTANNDDEPERDPDPTLMRLHTERYGPSGARRFVGIAPAGLEEAIRRLKRFEGRSINN